MSWIAAQPRDAAQMQPPLCVDLDGTLVKSDTLYDSLAVLMRSRPELLPGLPARILRGKAAFKAYVAESISLDVAHLPYNKELLRYLQQEHAQGRPIYLATGADVRLAERVADYLGIFTGVLGSDGATNLTGHKKLDRLRRRLESESFDYIGNDVPDLPLLAQAGQPMVANPSLRLRLGMKSCGIRPVRDFQERRPLVRSLIKAARVHHWAENVLIFVPMLLAHKFSIAVLLTTLMAFGCFCFTASAAYIVNDLLDIEADRRHLRKRMSPFAAGDLSVLTGLCISAILLALALAGASLLPPMFSVWLLLYLCSTLSYSLYLKRVALVDVLVLSGLYMLRLLAGSAATHAPISYWLAGISIFLFFSFAIAKRFSELEKLRSIGSTPKNGRS